MTSYTTLDNQSLIDLAVQLYGNTDAITELINLNDLTGKMELPPTMDSNEIDLAYSLKQNTVILYDENSANVNKAMLQRLHGLNKWQTRNGVYIVDGVALQLFLLDHVRNAGIAVGMRRLFAEYTGPIIRLRKGSGMSAIEQDIGYLSDGSLDTAAVITFLAGGTGYVTKWYDQSGNGRNFAQTSESNQPTITLTGINNKPSVSFSPKQYLTISSSTALFNYLHTNTGRWTMCMVLNQPTTFAKVIIANNEGSSANYGVFLGENSSDRIQLFLPSGASADVTVVSNNNYLTGSTFVNIAYNGTNYVLRRNSAAFQSIASTIGTITNNASTNLSMGATASGNNANTFKISELIIWPEDKTANNVTIEPDISGAYAF